MKSIVCIHAYKYIIIYITSLVLKISLKSAKMLESAPAIIFDISLLKPRVRVRVRVRVTVRVTVRIRVRVRVRVQVRVRNR